MVAHKFFLGDEKGSSASSESYATTNGISFSDLNSEPWLESNLLADWYKFLKVVCS